MSKTESKSTHFKGRSGSSSTAGTARGTSDFGDPELQPSCAYQLTNLINGQGTEGEFNRRGGDIRKLLHQEQRQQYEAIFCQVAATRLPKDINLELVEETRRIWRREYANLVPPDFKQMKKRRKQLRNTDRSSEPD